MIAGEPYVDTTLWFAAERWMVAAFVTMFLAVVIGVIIGRVREARNR